MDDADQCLPRRQRSDDLLADRLFLDDRDEIADHRQRDVGFEQREPHFAQRVLDIVVGQARLAAQSLDDLRQSFGEIFEHGTGPDTNVGEARAAARIGYTRAVARLPTMQCAPSDFRIRDFTVPAVAALYGVAAWLRSTPGGARSRGRQRRSSSSALVLHAITVGRAIVTPAGLDLSFAHALSLVAWLTVLLAGLSGVLAKLPSVGNVILPVAAVCALAPLAGGNPHRFPYAGEPWATAHIAVALVAYALFVVAALQALLLVGLEKRLHRGLALPEVDGTVPLLTLERFLFRLVGAGLRPAHADARERIPVLRAAFRPPADVQPQERVLRRRLAHVRRIAVRPLALRLARPAGVVLDPRRNRPAAARLPGQQVRRRGDTWPLSTLPMRASI